MQADFLRILKQFHMDINLLFHRYFKNKYYLTIKPQMIE